MSEPNQVIAEITCKTAELVVQISGVGPRGLDGAQGPPGETYIHPDTHPAEMIVESTDRVFLSGAEKNTLLTKKENYVHYQNTPSDEWSIPHGLGKFPNITVKDSAGSKVNGARYDVSVNLVILKFSGQFSGVAYLS